MKLRNDSRNPLIEDRWVDTAFHCQAVCAFLARVAENHADCGYQHPELLGPYDCDTHRGQALILECVSQALQSMLGEA